MCTANKRYRKELVNSSKQKRRFIILLGTILLALLINSSCEEPDPSVVAKGNRLLGIDITEAEDGDYDKAFIIAKNAGSEVVEISIFWDEIETSEGIYEPDPNYLAIANTYYPQNNTKVVIVISVIDTVTLRLPTYLDGVMFNAPEMIQSFKKLLDYIFTQIEDLDLISFSVGNEIDAYIGTNEILWNQYQQFFEEVSTYVKSKRTGLRIGTKATFSGITGLSAPYLQTINSLSDVVMVTYYPLNKDFTVKDPEVVENDFDTLTSLYEGKPISINEAGYQTSPVCNSSEEKQAQFIRNVFTAWDKHSSQIELIFFTWLTDLSEEKAEEFTSYYGLSTDEVFKEYLRTLGFRTYFKSGTDKKGFKAIKAEASKRGW